MTDMVAVPDGEDPKEWVAVHAVDFFNRISLIYGTLSDQCTRISCSSMTHTNGTKVSFVLYAEVGLHIISLDKKKLTSS